MQQIIIDGLGVAVGAHPASCFTFSQIIQTFGYAVPALQPTPLWPSLRQRSANNSLFQSTPLRGTVSSTFQSQVR